MVMAMLLGMCCQLTFNQLIAIFVNPFRSKNVRSIIYQYFGHFLSERVNTKRPLLVECKCATLPSPGEWPMTIVKEILQQMPAVGKPQATFLETLFATILALRGRVNFRNLSRYCDYCERTIARQF